MNEIVSLHRIDLSIISDRGTQFTSCFCKAFQKCLGTQVNPQMASQVKHNIQNVEDMFRDYFIDLRDVGMITYLCLSSLTTIPIIRSSPWNLLKLFMVEGIDL